MHMGGAGNQYDLRIAVTVDDRLVSLKFGCSIRCACSSLKFIVDLYCYGFHGGVWYCSQMRIAREDAKFCRR